MSVETEKRRVGTQNKAAHRKNAETASSTFHVSRKHSTDVIDARTNHYDTEDKRVRQEPQFPAKMKSTYYTFVITWSKKKQIRHNEQSKSL